MFDNYGNVYNVIYNIFKDIGLDIFFFTVLGLSSKEIGCVLVRSVDVLG